MKAIKIRVLFSVDEEITATRFSHMWQNLDVTHVHISECSRVLRSITFLIIITVHLCTAHKTTRNTLHLRRKHKFRNHECSDHKLKMNDFRNHHFIHVNVNTHVRESHCFTNTSLCTLHTNINHFKRVEQQCSLNPHWLSISFTIYKFDE
jgi:hypothetical protein